MVVSFRRFKEADAKVVSELIRRNFMEVNIKDYDEQSMKALCDLYDENKVRTIASYAHMYVAEYRDVIVGTGAISSFWGSMEESILLTIFVIPEWHGQGIGRGIVKTLERDELFLRAKRIEIPSSITSRDFYKKLGYDYKDGVAELDEEGHYRLEKIRSLLF